MVYSKLASAIYNDIVSGLQGYTSTPTLSLEQLEDDIVDERLALIKEYSLKGIIQKNDLIRAINCIPIDCKDIENCDSCTNSGFEGTPTMHFEIPPILTEFGGGIEYIGSADMQQPFLWYTNPYTMKYHKYRKRNKNRPYVYINMAPNSNKMYDCYVYNAPFLKRISVLGIFKDERLLKEFGCDCTDEDATQSTFMNAEIKDRVIQKKIKYYRQLATGPRPNDQVPK